MAESPHETRCGLPVSPQVLKVAGWDGRAAVLYAPKLLQALLAAATDTYVFLLARTHLGPAAAK